ncbi:flagellar M-ring protein FliF C-terminal domain-containing protein [Sulfitobacter pacificus]|uniref:flagellar M-ring protein FliF C-terminal domain-containing protein n=1 Tax=Sulfitobacter pacificus TaxID=1499314 RepID=UPI003610B23E
MREAGEVRRLTVAVLVNGIYNLEGSDVAYVERTPEELNRLTELVKSAVGFEEGRGDSVSVDSMRFMDYSMDLGDPIVQTIGDRLSESIVPIIRGVLALLIVALVMILGVRPMLRRLNQPDPLNVVEEPALESDTVEREGLAAPDSTPNASGTKLLATDTSGASSTEPRKLSATPVERDELTLDDQQYVTTQGIRGSIQKGNIDKIQRLADEKPEEVLRVMRSWLTTEAEA